MDITLDELKDHLNITSSRDDAELMLHLGAAVGAVEGIVGPLTARTVVETARGNGSTVLLSQYPVVSVTSLTETELPITYSTNLAAGLLSEVYTYGTVEATYVVGRTTIPDDLRLAVLIIAGHLWKLQQGATPSALQGDEFDVTPGMGYAIPSRAQDLLAPHALPPSVA